MVLLSKDISFASVSGAFPSSESSPTGSSNEGPVPVLCHATKEVVSMITDSASNRGYDPFFRGCSFGGLLLVTSRIELVRK